MIGNLKHLKFNNDFLNYYEGYFYSTLFNKNMKVSIDEDVPMEYAEKCINHFNNLPNDLLDSLYEQCIEYYEDTLVNIDDDLEIEFDMPKPEDINGKDILKYISVGTLEIQKSQGDNIAYILELNCVWEEEHGCEWVIKDNQVLYVGQFYHTSPYDIDL